MKRCGDKAGEGTFTFGKMPEETEGSLMMMMMKVVDSAAVSIFVDIYL